MSDTVQQIKDRLEIQDIVGGYVKLTKAGKSLRGLCPFHKEKTPSFHVSPERGTWHCFGCGLGGDGFSFIEKIEGVDFKGALKILAEKAGVVVEYSQSGNENASKKERLRELMNKASEWYAGKLIGSPAEEYAKSRGLTKETVLSWRLGFAPDAWRALLEAMTALGFTNQELLAAGLIKEADGKKGTYYDRFRNRLMFPIRDGSGRVVAFTGRALPAEDSAEDGHDENIAKYLNSPETELYHKSEILFGMDRAKDAIRTRKFAMLVEGQMDALLAHQAGFENTVALSGTALSEKHITLIKRYSENLMLVLDADSAGLSATAKSALLALSAGLKVKAARLTKGKDPADLIKEDPKEFSKCVTAAKPIVDFFLTSLGDTERDPHRLISSAERIILPLIAVMPSPMEREHFTQVTARALGLSNETIQESLKRQKYSAAGSSTTKGAQKISVDARPPKDIRSEQLLSILYAYPDTPLAHRVKTEYGRIIGDQPFPAGIPPEPALFNAEQMFGENPDESAADELLLAFEETIVREMYQEAVMNLRKAESSQPADDSAIKNAQAKCSEISARLSALH
jgi:DNA primase